MTDVQQKSCSKVAQQKSVCVIRVSDTALIFVWCGGGVHCTEAVLFVV